MKRFIFSFILVFLTFVTLIQCGGNSRGLTEDEKDIQELLSEQFKSLDELVYNEDTLIAGSYTLDFYKKNGFKPIWTDLEGLTPAGKEMQNLVNNAYNYGFLPEMFSASLINKMADSSLTDTEVLLSNAFFLFDTHIHLGCIDSSNYQYTWKKDSLPYNLNDELISVFEGTPVQEVIEKNQPDFLPYQVLQKGLVNFINQHNLDTTHVKIPEFKDDSVACYAAVKTALLQHGFIDSNAVKNDSLFIEHLKEFQLISGLKPDAIAGKWTSYSLERSNMDRFYQAALSLEKWRWRKKYPEQYIRVNIPEYALYYVNDNKIERKHRVVVGAYATQTPEFSASMERLVTNPFWHVPYSISSTEILYNARKDSSYLNKKGYKIFKNGEQVDPQSVDWSEVKQNNFPYRVRQEGGSGNSLGRIKFLFPNSHFVFIHDTPSKRLFSNDMRAYSHGCVRVEDPFDLAKSILGNDRPEFVGDTLDSIINKGTQRVYELNQTFEVFIEYFTTTADSNGQIIFHPDIYSRDEKYLTHTFKSFQK